jgi:hypothetical protein
VLQPLFVDERRMAGLTWPGKALTTLFHELGRRRVEADAVELLLWMPENNPSIRHGIDGVGGNIQVLSKPEEACLDLDDLTLHASDRTHLLAGNVANIQAGCDPTR